MASSTEPASSTTVVERRIDPTEGIEVLLRDLRSSRRGLSTREAERRLVHYGLNQLQRRGGRRWPRELARQFTHPLALLLWAAAGLAFVAGIVPVAIAILVVILVNAAFAFVQELHAERAVEALAAYLPAQAKVLRDGGVQLVDVRGLVPGDVLVIEEGDRISADARLISGVVEVDMSTLTGESVPVVRTAETADASVPRLRARDLVFSGTTCTQGEARAVVFATGMHTELGRIAALSERIGAEESPLQHQVRRVAWLIAAIAALMGIAFIPIAAFGAGLSLSEAVVFAVGLIVGNVPEGLLPVITLALAVGVRGLVRQGALVKRLSAVETLGSTDVICTDKTGTLTENRMRVTDLWAADTRFDPSIHRGQGTLLTQAMAETMAACNNSELREGVEGTGDPTEVALLAAAAAQGVGVDRAGREARRLAHFRFDPLLKLMSTVDEAPDGRRIHTKGAPEALLPRCVTVLGSSGVEQPLDQGARGRVAAQVDAFARDGLRILALGRRQLDPAAPLPAQREEAETGLCLVGLVAMLDPPRPEVAAAVARCHKAGIRIIIVTGDHGLTAAAIARQVGIGRDAQRIVTGEELDAMREVELDELLRGDEEIIFARSSPEAKLRIADALRAEGHVVAMTGDGVNDAPALRRAEIGIAMGRSGTDVAREAATMVLTDDNFATIVAAVEAGRRVYDNIRKFILYIFAHTTPEVVPFLVFALAGGAIPLPLTILQLLAFDVGTETLPALALGREPPEPGLMDRPPRGRSESIIQRSMLVRAWLFLGIICAVLAMAGFFWVLTRAGWHPGDDVSTGPLHHAYRQATTMTFLGMVAGQIGTAFAARTEHASLRSIGVLSNRLLLWGIVFEVALAAAIVYLPPLQDLFQTAALSASDLLFLAPFPFVVWGADELRRWLVRRARRKG